MRRQTIFLARLFGLFMIVVALWKLVDEPRLTTIVEAVVQDRPVTVLVGVMCLGAGLAVVFGHQIWSGGIAPVLVALLGYIPPIRGVALLFLAPNLLGSVANALSGPARLCPVGSSRSVMA